MQTGLEKLQLKHVLDFCETSQVPPVSREVFKLVSVDGNQHKHGVGHNEPPEELQQAPPQRIVNLKNRNKLKVKIIYYEIQFNTKVPEPIYLVCIPDKGTCRAGTAACK